jgi:hypothetical protein
MRIRASALLLAIPFAAAAPVTAQQVALQETFEFSVTGIFPPAGWTEVDLTGAGNPGWQELGTAFCTGMSSSDVAGHDAPGVGNQETRLVSPVLDLSTFSAPRLQFHTGGCNTWALTSSGQGYADDHFVEVSTDGGSTWTIVWTAFTSGANGYEIRPEVIDLSNYAGESQVQVGFRYIGSETQWTIDTVIVVDAATGGSLQLIGACGQPNSYLFVQNVTPLANIALLGSPSTGGRLYSSPACSVLASSLGAWPGILVTFKAATGFGTAEFTRPGGIPATACGKFVQAFDMATCLPTNLLQL